MERRRPCCPGLSRGGGARFLLAGRPRDPPARSRLGDMAQAGRRVVAFGCPGRGLPCSGLGGGLVSELSRPRRGVGGSVSGWVVRRRLACSRSARVRRL